MKNIWKIIRLLGRDSVNTVMALCRKGVFDAEWDSNEHPRLPDGTFAKKGSITPQSNPVNPPPPKTSNSWGAKSYSANPIRQQQCESQINKTFPRYYNSAQMRHANAENARMETQKLQRIRDQQYEIEKQTNPNAVRTIVIPKSYFTIPLPQVAKQLKSKSAKGQYKVFYDKFGNARLRFLLDGSPAVAYNTRDRKFTQTNAVQLVYDRMKGLHAYPIEVRRYNQGW